MPKMWIVRPSTLLDASKASFAVIIIRSFLIDRNKRVRRRARRRWWCRGREWWDLLIIIRNRILQETASAAFLDATKAEFHDSLLTLAKRGILFNAEKLNQMAGWRSQERICRSRLLTCGLVLELLDCLVAFLMWWLRRYFYFLFILLMR